MEHYLSVLTMCQVWKNVLVSNFLEFGKWKREGCYEHVPPFFMPIMLNTNIKNKEWINDIELWIAEVNGQFTVASA